MFSRDRTTHTLTTLARPVGPFRIARIWNLYPYGVDVSPSNVLRRIAFDSYDLLGEIPRPRGPDLKGVDPGVGL